MKKKLFWLQLAALGLSIFSVIALGILIFSRNGLENLTPVYVLAGLALAGVLANAGLATARVLWELRERNQQK